MKTNDFIKEHITIDERQRISKKLNLLSKKYSEFGHYLELIQKENIAKLFIHIKINGFLIQSMTKEDMKRNSFRHYINILLANKFIETSRPTPKQLEEMGDLYSDYVANIINYYTLTKKGKDFLNLDLIREYLDTEYEDYKNELL